MMCRIVELSLWFGKPICAGVGGQAARAPVTGQIENRAAASGGPGTMERVMKAFILAAVAALSLGIGSAYAAQGPFHYSRPNVIQWGPDFSNDVSGG
jgi:hypothetical protein